MKYGLVAGLLWGLALAQSASALTISPVRLEVAADPGQTLTSELQLYNEESEMKVFYSSSANFESRGESGAPFFLPNNHEGLASWISIQPEVSLASGERQIVPFTITIPPGTTAGGYFAAIFWGTAEPTAGGSGQVSVGGKLGMLILLSVNGDFGSDQKSTLTLTLKEEASLLTSLPATFVYRFTNSGRQRVKPAGSLLVKNIFGKKMAEINANRFDGNVLPGSARKFDLVWQKRGQTLETDNSELTPEDSPLGFFSIAGRQWRNWAFGRYAAELELTFGPQNERLSAQTSFWIIPWQLLVLLGGGLLLVVASGWWIIRRYNRWIISRAARSSAAR